MCLCAMLVVVVVYAYYYQGQTSFRAPGSPLPTPYCWEYEIFIDSTKSLLNDNQQGSAMLWVSLSLLASSALVIQHSVVHGQVFAVTMNSTTKVQNPRQNSA